MYRIRHLLIFISLLFIVGCGESITKEQAIELAEKVCDKDEVATYGKRLYYFGKCYPTSEKISQCLKEAVANDESYFLAKSYCTNPRHITNH